MEEEKKNQRKAVILMIVGVITLIALVIGATYAYFSAQVGTGDKAQINAKAGTTDDLTFATTGPITITANQTNFAEGQESLSDSATATAHLIAGDDDNTATEHYYLYLQIDANNLTYTVGKEQPELIMEITDPNKQPYTEPIEGLEYKTEITDGKGISYSGYDITEAKGLFAIAKNYEIIASNNKTDTWTIKVTFLNLSTDQHENTDKTLTGKLIIQKEEYVPQDMKNVNQLLADANKDGEITLYHHDAELEGGAQDDSYRYAGGYILSDELKAKGYSEFSDIYNHGDHYGDAFYYFMDSDDHEYYQSFDEIFAKAIEYGYLVPNVKNYVCLDSKTTGDCETEEDLYRIIGLFKNAEGQYEMKLIKYDYATSTQLGETGAYYNKYYYWTGSDNSTNEWAGSALRKTNLNDYYLNTYLKETKGIDVDNLITTHIWSLNGHDDYSETPKVMYDNEMDKVESEPSYPTQTKTVNDKIGLMYASDYGYAASPNSTTNWTISLGNYTDNIINKNWMYMGSAEWTISRSSSGNSYALYVSTSGRVESESITAYHAVRPCFYLSSDVKIKEGNGTKEIPYRITFE